MNKAINNFNEIAENVLSVDPQDGGNSLPSANNITTTPAPDPFDPASLRLSPENINVSVKKIITVIPCRKPNRQEFIRTRSGDEWRLDCMLLEDQGTRDNFIVDSNLHDDLAQDCFPARLVLAITRSNDLFLWRLKLSLDGRTNNWNDSMLAAAKLAETKWVRIVSNLPAGFYDIHEADGINVEPQWPDLEFNEILRICFKDHIINSLDHPILKRLRGEV